MEYSDNTNTSSMVAPAEGCLNLPPSPVSNSPPPAIISPCAACKILRRRCIENCIMAPYFPPDQPLKFTIAHRVFGASNIIKFLRELPECQRADAVISMVYEAKARLRDPVYGCAGSICHLQKQIIELKIELAKAQAYIFNMECQNSNLFDLICKKVEKQLDQQNYFTQIMSPFPANPSFFFDENVLGVAWEPLWT